jgi:2,4-dienoyl-CoA reductase-like NADH-dependent reductase (Old Yellow Enzyme family)
MKSIFDSTIQNHLKMKNRLFRSATWDGLVGTDGSLNDEIYQIYEDLAKGGVGTIITGLTDISENNQALPGNMRLFSDEHISDYILLNNIVHKYDCNIIPQLNINHYVVMDDKSGQMQQKEIDEFTNEDFENIVELYRQAAIRSKQAGFDGIQIHAAFNWLLNRSINPKFNHRTDAYGGSSINRTKLLVDVLKAIRTALPDTFITTKLGFYSKADDQKAIEQYVCTCCELAKNGIDSIEVSENRHLLGIVPSKEEAEFLPLALEVKKYTNVPIILVGRHRHIDNMERILNETSVEYFSLSRALIREPDLPSRWKRGDCQPAKCVSCDGCFQMHGKRCVYNN